MTFAYLPPTDQHNEMNSDSAGKRLLVCGTVVELNRRTGRCFFFLFSICVVRMVCVCGVGLEA